MYVNSVFIVKVDGMTVKITVYRVSFFYKLINLSNSTSTRICSYFMEWPLLDWCPVKPHCVDWKNQSTILGQIHYEFHSHSCTNPVTTSKAHTVQLHKASLNYAGRATSNNQFLNHRDLIGANSTCQSSNY